MRLLYGFIVPVLFILNATSFAQTTVQGGEVSGNWSLSASPYKVQGDISVPNDSTLIIEPGVRVEFQGHFSLTVLGRLLAIGTLTDSILFTVKDTSGFSKPDTSMGGWNGIRFTDTPTQNDSSKIVYCCLEYSKAFGPVWHLNAGGAISILQFGKVLISNCMIRNNSAGSSTDHLPVGGGLYLFKSDIILKNNAFINNRAHSGGAIFMDDSNPVFINNLIESNYAIYGAGVSLGAESHPVFTNDVFSNNVAKSNGGGLLVGHASVVKCDHVSVSGNRATWGGGIGVQGGELLANNCLFFENHAELWGGGVAGDFATLSIDNCSFEKDSSNWGSGGIHMDHSIAAIKHCEFEGNKSVFGGGLHAVYSQITSEQNTFLDNHCESGGALHLENSDCIIDRSTFYGNQALNGHGGAIYYKVDTTTFGRKYRYSLSRSSLEENIASMSSGAVHIEHIQADSSMLDALIDSCQFTRNHADIYGSVRIGGSIEDFVVSSCILSSNTSSRYVAGAGFIANSQGKVLNCVFIANYSSYSDSTKSAHGVSLGSGAEVDFFNCSFVDTSSANGVGLTLRRGCKANIFNSIFWGCGNRPINIVTAAEEGCSININYCNIENGIDSIFVSDSLSELHWGEGNLAEDPQFADLENGDLHLKDASPCIASGINSFILNDVLYTAPTRDVEGIARPSPPGTQADMGAYENILGTPVGLVNNPARNQGDFKLFQNFPNPFNQSTTFTYQLPSPAAVQLSIYNVLGQRVAILLSESQPVGIYRVRWDASDFMSGHYIYRLETSEGMNFSGKLLLIK